MNTVPRDAGYVDEDGEESPVTAAMASQLTSAMAMVQQQNQQLQKSMQQSQDMVTNMKMAVMQTQMELQSMKYTPLITPMLAASGVFAGMPLHAMTSASILRQLGADGSVREEAHFSFDPNGPLQTRLNIQREANDHEEKITEMTQEHEIDWRSAGSLRNLLFGKPRERS